jgi:hypothetical protein
MHDRQAIQKTWNEEHIDNFKREENQTGDHLGDLCLDGRVYCDTMPESRNNEVRIDVHY